MNKMRFSVGSCLRKFYDGKGLRAQLLRSGIGSLSVKALQAIIAFTLAVVLARALGPAGYGLYSLSLAVLMLTSIPAQVGIPQLVVRETAKTQAMKDWSLMRGLWRWANIGVFIFSSLGILIVVASLFIMARGEDVQSSIIMMGIPLIPLVALANVRAACLRGLRFVVWGQLPESIYRPAILLMFTVGWIAIVGTDSSPTPLGVMALHVLAAVISFALGALMLWNYMPQGVKNQITLRYEHVAWRKSVIPLAMITGLHLINSYADLITIGLLRTHEEVGVYRVVFEVSLLVVFGLKAFNQVLNPYVAQLFILHKHAELQRLITNSARAILALAVPVTVLFIAFGGEFLAVVFGEPYQTGALALTILALGQLVSAGLGSVGVLLNMTGHEKEVLKGVGIAAVVNIILNLALVPSYGIEGAASATAASLIIWNLMLWRSVRRRLNLSSTAFTL